MKIFRNLTLFLIFVSVFGSSSAGRGHRKSKATHQSEKESAVVYQDQTEWLNVCLDDFRTKVETECSKFRNIGGAYLYALCTKLKTECSKFMDIGFGWTNTRLGDLCTRLENVQNSRLYQCAGWVLRGAFLTTSGGLLGVGADTALAGLQKVVQKNHAKVDFALKVSRDLILITFFVSSIQDMNQGFSSLSAGLLMFYTLLTPITWVKEIWFKDNASKNRLPSKLSRLSSRLPQNMSTQNLLRLGCLLADFGMKFGQIFLVCSNVATIAKESSDEVEASDEIKEEVRIALENLMQEFLANLTRLMDQALDQQKI